MLQCNTFEIVTNCRKNILSIKYLLYCANMGVWGVEILYKKLYFGTVISVMQEVKISKI